MHAVWLLGSTGFVDGEARLYQTVGRAREGRGATSRAGGAASRGHTAADTFERLGQAQTVATMTGCCGIHRHVPKRLDAEGARRPPTLGTHSCAGAADGGARNGEDDARELSPGH